MAGHLPLHSERQSEPDGRSVEQGGDHLIHDVPGVARRHRRQRLVVVPKRVHVEEPRGGKQKREHVAQSHRHEDGIGGRPHVTLGEDDHNQGVGDDCDEEEKGHDVAVHGLCIADGKLRGNVEVVETHHGEVREGRVPQRCVEQQLAGRDFRDLHVSAHHQSLVTHADAISRRVRARSTTRRVSRDYLISMATLC